MDPLPLFLLVLGVLVLAWIVWSVLGVQILTVKDGQQLVVHRFGKFDRVLSPGLNVILKNHERIEQTIDTREQPQDFILSGLFVYNVPFGYTLNLWYRNDPMTTARGQKDELTRLVLFTDEDRREQAQTKVRDALVRAVSAVQQRRPSADDKPFVYKIPPILPGTTENQWLLEQVDAELRETLPTIGVILSQTHPITVKRFDLAKSVIKTFEQNLTVSSLREYFPGISQERLLHMFSAVQGLDVSKIQEITLASELQQAEAHLELGETGNMRLEVPTLVRSKTTPSAAGDAPVTNPSPPLSAPLTLDDLRLLKQVPRSPNVA